VASIQKRPPRTAGGSATYRVRCRDPAGVQRSKTFDKLSQAKSFQATVEADKARGTYVDQSLGRMTLGEYAELWLAMQTYGESTREQTAHRVRRHVIPSLGATPLAALRTSQVQAWVRAKQQELGPRTVRLLVSLLSSILNAAVDDERIAKNPCRSSSIRLPKLDDRKIVPWTEQQVRDVRQALPDRYRIMLTITTGLGLRQGEVFGLAVEDVDFLRGVVRVQRQVSIVGSRLVFALPKGRKVREVPLASSVADLLSAHLQAFPARAVRLPWEVPSGPPVEARLFLSSREGGALNRNYVNRSIWKPALTAAGMPATREQGMHSGRHFYASVQLEAGTSIRALAEYLGHADPGFALRTYTHLMPQSQDKAKRAVNDVFERLGDGADDPLCGPDVAPEAL
jgi:integrase